MIHQVTLVAPGVELVPLDYGHAPGLLALVDAEWRWLSWPMPRTLLDLERFVLAAHQDPSRLAFAVLAPGGEVRGTTSLLELDAVQGRAVTGSTVLGGTWRGEGTNPAAKLAVLTHAFDTLGLHRVALRADVDNHRSIAAIERLGAVREGVLRAHRAADGGYRDSVSFSILAPQWPRVRADLRRRLRVPEPA